MTEYMSEAQYMYLSEDPYIEDYYSSPRIEATSYNAAGKSMMHLTGREMIGRNCPTCGSKLVQRTNSKDSRKFVSCDKTKRSRCPFSISMNETLYDRTNRVEEKVLALASKY